MTQLLWQCLQKLFHTKWSYLNLLSALKHFRNCYQICFYSACCKAKYRHFNVQKCFKIKTLPNNNVPGLRQLAGHHILSKKGKTWDVSKMNIMVVRAGRHRPVFVMRGMFYIKQETCINWGL